MARRIHQSSPDNRDRWLVSYADFMTLLFAFFVVMYATAQADRSKAKEISEAVSQALDSNHLVAKLAALLNGSSRDAARAIVRVPAPPPGQGHGADLNASLQRLTAELKTEIEAGKIRVNLEARGLVISLTQAAFFPSGTDEIEPTALESIGKIAAVVRLVPNGVRLEGHTDSRPIHSARFHSNWDLSAARAIAVLEVLNTRFDIPRDRLAISGYAETAAVDTNETEAGRARNRRVDIVVLTEQSMASQPPGTRAAASAASPAAPASAGSPSTQGAK
jgi:chemotaxis protein MotB